MDGLRRSLHVKLVLIMVLLVIALMTVAGAFLINSVGRFYLKEFYTEMTDFFAVDAESWQDLQEAPEGETDPVASIERYLAGNMGVLGVDGRNRNYYILNTDGAYLGGSLDPVQEEAGYQVEITENIRNAILTGEPSSKSSITASCMDVAIPITRGGNDYIIYIMDNRQTVQDLSRNMFILIIEALGFGLVISVLLSFLLSKTMVIPIQRLTEGAQRMAQGDFRRVMAVASQDEIGVLTDTFNDMARQMEKTLQTVENERAKLDALFLHMTDGVVAVNRNGEVIHANPAAEEMLAQPIPVGGSVTYDQLFGSIAPLWEVLSREHESLEGELTREDRSLELLFAPFDREEQAGVLVVIHDVTEQMKTEYMRREFVANVSHELRTPLTNIRSYAETLADTPDLPEEMRGSFLQVILNESDRMTHIVQDLLTLSRFDSGKSGLTLSVFPLEAALQDLCRAVQMEAHKRGHQLELRLEESLPDIRADRERILQVLMNVVSNAIKYTPDNGEILIAAGRQEGGVWVEVTDNGIGIPTKDRDRIFDRFYRVDKARSRESGGTGLGLSIAKEIVKQHEGGLTLVNRAGPGTTIRLELKTEGPADGQ